MASKNLYHLPTGLHCLGKGLLAELLLGSECAATLQGDLSKQVPDVQCTLLVIIRLKINA